MMEQISSSGPSGIHTTFIEFPGQKITWGGEGIAGDTFLFGTESGLVFESGIDAPLQNSRAFRAVKDREAINGLAYSMLGDQVHLGVTTRSEIVLHRFAIDGTMLGTCQNEVGAHGIFLTSNKNFVSPAGPTGFLHFFLDADGEYTTGALIGKGGIPYFYGSAILSFNTTTQEELVVAACRTGGMVFIELPAKGNPRFLIASKVRDKSVDFVGVTSIGNARQPVALIGLGKDRTIHFMRDFLGSRSIESLELPLIRGTAYRLLRHKAHLLLLTSKGICVIRDIVRQFHDGEDIGGYRHMTFIGMDAIDFNIAFDRWLLIVTPEGVVRIDLHKLFPRPEAVIPDVIQDRMRSTISSLWSSYDSAEEMEQPVWQDRSLDVVPLETSGTVLAS